MAHTKGEWTIEPHGDVYALYSGRDNQHHGARLMNLSDGDKDFRANCNLIVYAPELLETCINLQKRLETLIHLTPTGMERNIMTEENITAMSVIEKASGK